MAHKINPITQKHRILFEVVVETNASEQETFKGIKRGIFRGLDTPPTMIAAPDKVAVNNVEDYLETYFEIVGGIFKAMESQEPNAVRLEYEKRGRGAMYELAKEWTDEFQSLHAETEWDGDWIEVLEEFFNSKNELK